MRDDQTVPPEDGAAAPLDRSVDPTSAKQTHGKQRAARLVRQFSDDLRPRIESLRGLPRAALRRFESPAVREWLGLHRPGRLMVAGGIICSLGLAAFAETQVAPDGLLSSPVANAEAERAQADRAASRADRATGEADAATEGADVTALPPDPDAAEVVVEPTEPALPPGHRESGPVAGLSEVQMNNAKAIVWTGVDMGMPRRALVIAVATAMQESNLLNRASEVVPESKRYPHQGTGWDHDSVGLFQQRTSTGWGPVKKLMDPAYASQRFYRALMRVPGWQNMRLTEAAQAVQVSAFPEHYAKHEARATVVVDALADVD
ncbi:MAG TPA: peptidase M23 [Micromonosporaceae bacterium]|nr:peptidase M23 [Micromonosporaceae bacterium]